MDIDHNSALENLLALPCPSCGSELSYSAEHKKISCNHCGYKEEVDDANDLVRELSLSKAVSEAKSYSPEAIGKKVFDCQNCGAKFLLDAKVVKVKCSFCASRNVNVEAFEHNFIQPMGVIPFQIPEEEADEKFDSWIKKGWFHPTKLKRMASKDVLNGMYVPFWTFDAQTETDYSGQAGYHYYVSETVRTGDKTTTRQVKKTRWEYRSGHLSHFFDDILVVAANKIKQSLIERILPFQLSKMVNFDPRLLSGWEAEVYDIELNEGYNRADTIMDRKIRELCKQAIGGDVQRNVRTQSHKFNQTFKHVLLPVWLCSYVYMDKTYQFAINGQTGKIKGEKPISWVKIGFLIFLFVAIIMAIYFWKTQ
ncbi:MAG: hypothetical protein AAF502_06065 [Bacteroidota bacterium]